MRGGEGAHYSTSTGDEAGNAKGVVSSSTKGVCEFMTYSFNVKFEGGNVCRLGDPLYHNKKEHHELTACKRRWTS